MLLSLTRVGAARQSIRKGVAVQGMDAAALTRISLPEVSGGPLRAVAHERTPGLVTVETPLTWLGTPAARDEVFAALGQAIWTLAEAARRARARLLPTAVTLGEHPAVLGGDVHELVVLDEAEQEVLCNLLRRCSPALIAFAGRGVVGPGRPRDPVGSRWLADSAEHLATRYLASTSRNHLERVRAELRRSGVARLEQMDIAPRELPDGTRTVVVRCLDAQASLAVTRAHAVLLAALSLHARRMVRDGRRERNLPQRDLEEDRARAVATGTRALLVGENRQDRPDRRSGPRPSGATRTAAPRKRASVAMRQLQSQLRPDFAGLDASVHELAPLLAALDLPGLGVDYRRTDDLLHRWIAESPHIFEKRLLDALCDGSPGGTVLSALRAADPGKVALILGSWHDRLTRPPEPARPSGGDSGHGRGRRRGGKGGRR